MPALGQVGKRLGRPPTPEVIAFATTLKKLYLRLPKQSMVRNAAILHVSQPALSQYLNLARVPPAPFLKTIYLTAAARSPEGELPCGLNELIEMRRAAKGSLSHAGTRDQDAKNGVAHTTACGKPAGKRTGATASRATRGTGATETASRRPNRAAA